MGDQQPQILLDTKVWIDYYLGARPGHELARALVGRALGHDATLLYATLSSKDVFYVIASVIKRDCRAKHGTLSDAQATAATATAWACLDNMSDIATAVGCDQSDVWLARNTRRLHADYEDDLILAAARRAGADLLVTSDEQLLRHAPVAALDVPDALAYLDSRQK